MRQGSKSLFEKDWFWILLMAGLFMVMFHKLLFTGQIIRASDVITQFFWDAKGMKEQPVLDYLRTFPGIFKASWDTLSDGGRTLEGGWNAIGFLFYRYLILHFFPFPAGIAWLAVLSLLWGAVGTFFYCRANDVSRFGAFIAGIVFALCTENASLINAGHIQKIEAISYIPWVLLFLDKALRRGKIINYALAALMLALQFFTMHWQISFYTCLTVGLYWFWQVGARFLAERSAYAAPFKKDLLLSVVMVLLFFSTIAMSFAPLVSWSKQSERGDAVTSSSATAPAAAQQTGIGYDEGMSWSMPPEEILTYVVPGLVGFSRQEGGDEPQPGQVYYWGRMRFTQTGDYLGLLPWLLIPLPLLFRRDRITWFCTFLMAATLIMALGKYTFVYRFMFEHLPAFSKFRVPKMVLCVFAFGAAVLTGRGFDILAAQVADRKKLRWWLCWCGGVAAVGAALAIILKLGGEDVISFMADSLTAPTRYQSGDALIRDRFGFMIRESALACLVGSLYFATLLAWFRKWLPPKVVLAVLCFLLLGDLWRVNEHFLVVTTPPPSHGKAAKNDIVQFLEPRIGQYRMQPMNEENAHYYADHGFANVSAYVTISERRYKEFLESFTLSGAMPDMVNLKYLIMKPNDFQAQQAELGAKYQPVFVSSNGSLVLENRTVLPKAWLVPSAVVVPDSRQQLGIISSDPAFDPARVALVETLPPLPLAPYGQAVVPGIARVDSYTSNRIVVSAAVSANSLLVLGEKYYKWWYATVDGKSAEIYPVNHILRGVYLPPGNHTIEFLFDPLPFKIGKYVTLASFALFAVLLGREFMLRRGRKKEAAADADFAAAETAGE